MNKGYTLIDGTIILNRELNDLDLFVKDFLDVLKKYSSYLVVSGYVSISSGRTRGTEDVDVLVEVFDKKLFEKLFYDLEKNNFWCYQSDDFEEVYDYVREMKSIRFARKNEMFPNIEFILVDESKKAKYFEFTHPQKIRVKDFEFLIPPIEFEILYKEIVLGGDKDLADAKHLRLFYSEILEGNKFNEYKKIIIGEIKNEIEKNTRI